MMKKKAKQEPIIEESIVDDRFVSRLSETPTVRKEIEQINEVFKKVKWPPGFFDRKTKA